MGNRVYGKVTIDVDFVKYHMKTNKIRMTNDLDKKLGVSSRTIKRWFDDGCIPYDMLDTFRESIGITMPQLCGYNLPEEYTAMKKEEELSKLNKYTLYFEITKLSEMNDNGIEYMGASFEDACTRYKDAHINDHRIFDSYETALEYSTMKRIKDYIIDCSSVKDYVHMITNITVYIRKVMDNYYEYMSTMLLYRKESECNMIMEELNPKLRELVFTYNLLSTYLELLTSQLGLS